MTKRKGGPSLGVTENYNKLLCDTLTLIYARALVGAHRECYQTLVQADPDNSGSVFVGGAGAQTIELTAGDSITIPADPSLIFVRGNGNTVNWLAVG